MLELSPYLGPEFLADPDEPDVLMRPPLALVFAALWLARAGAAELPAPITWHLDQTAQIGGQAPTILGAPQVVVGPPGKAARISLSRFTARR